MKNLWTEIGKPGLMIGLCLLWVLTVPRMAHPAGQPSLTVCIETDIDSFDPTGHRSRVTQLVLRNIFESLTARDDKLDVVPELASSWELIDPVTWEFSLKKGVVFHNGDEFTAKDVKFTFDRVLGARGMGGLTSPRRDLFSSIGSVEIVDPYTIRFHTRHPWAILPKMLSLQEIVPRKYMEAVGGEAFNREPVGTGPFRLESFPSGDRIMLSRFQDHRGFKRLTEAECQGLIERLVFEVVPLPIDRIAKLKSGRAQLIFNVPPSAVGILETTPGIQVVSTRATRSHFAEINCAKPPFGDARLRRALNLAVDMPAVVDNVLLGRGQILSTILQSNSFGYNDFLKPYPFDPASARKLIESSGYPPKRPLIIQGHVSYLELGNALVLFYTKAGLKASLQATDLYRPDTLGPGAPWDLYIGSWGNSTQDPEGIIPPKLATHGRGNFSGYSNGQVDRLVALAEDTTDSSLRADYYRRIQEIVYEDAPMVFGYASDEIYALNKRISGFNPSPTGIFRLDNLRLSP
ncbi:MAG: hypothetical protein KKB20_04110 [Proteobacteria bacterium]|nr:hypothetical protein [Pseudomonadota bacterium]